MITLPLIITWAVGGACGAIGGIIAKRAYTKITKQQALMQSTIDEHRTILKGGEEL